MKKSIFKRWWFWVIIVVVLIGAISSQGGNDVTPTQSTAAPAPVKEVMPEVVVTAADLSAAFEANEVKANKDYKDKLAEITGTVDSVGEMLGQTFVVLSSGKDFSIVNVQCFFDDKAEIDKIAELNKGDTVTIMGNIDGMSMNVGVNGCILK